MKNIFNLILIIYILSSCTNGIKLLEKNKRDLDLLMEGKDYQTSLKHFVDYFISHNTRDGDTIIFNDLKIINELGNDLNINVYFKNYINSNFTFKEIRIFRCIVLNLVVKIKLKNIPYQKILVGIFMNIFWCLKI